ncbi:FUSC family protein [Zafaria cholistanensis]|uniref:FUSC family protein n=1 Tax=Zafaria cholistanensis TaxID=1682741 RepID=A0A5A7NQ43_9MICC|nr:FUSC family protein [Zafaria cholistanensis]GER22809.1 FUSC family protein [Zafaria cholistanensis]
MNVPESFPARPGLRHRHSTGKQVPGGRPGQPGGERAGGERAAPSFAWRAMFRLAPADEDHFIALRVALGVFLPLAFLVVTGRMDLAVFVVFGAFTGVYGRVKGHRDRLNAQLRAGALFWVVVLAAWLSSALLVEHGTPSGPWTLVGLTTVVAGACALAAAHLRIRPGGSLFHIFAFAAIASLPALPPLGESLAAVALAVLLSVAIGLAGWLLPGRRTPWVRTPQAPLTPLVRRALRTESFEHLLAAGLAGSLATALAPVLSTSHNYWAMVAAVVPLVGQTTRHQVVRGVHRVLGTLAGLLLMGAVILVDPDPWAAVLLMGLMQFATEMLITRNYFWAQVFVTPLALVGTSLGAGLSVGLLHDRMLETVIGATVGIGVVLAGAAYARRVRRRLGLDSA